jgi:putative sigma-54 modulation protein
MDIRITGRNLDVTDQVRAYIEKKLGRLSRYTEIPEIHVILSLERHLAVVEAMLKTRNKTFYGSESSENLYEAVDKLLDNLRSQLKKYKEKIIDTHRISS